MSSDSPALISLSSADTSEAGGKNFLSRFCRWVSNLRGRRRFGAAFLSGALMAGALAPFYLTPLMFISLPVFVILLDGIKAQTISPKRAFWLFGATGWFFGFGYFTAGLWWLADAMTVDLAQFWWAIPFAVFGLPVYLALYYALAAMLAFLFWRKGLIRIIALAIAFAGGEYLRGALLTGFPWNAIGYAAMPCPLLMQIDAILGLNIINGLAVFIFCLPACLWRGSSFNSRRAAAAALILGVGLILADISFGAYCLHFASALQTGKKILRVRIVQPNIRQEDKQDSAFKRQMFEEMLRLSRAVPEKGRKQPDLIIWPETAIPYLLDYNPQALAQIGANLQSNQLLLAGTIRVEKIKSPHNDTGKESEREYLSAHYRFFNSMALINSSAKILAQADKVHLVPFGEYLPAAKLLHFLHLSALAEAAGPYSAPNKHQPIRLPESGVSLWPLICYEAIFPREARANAEEKTDILVNITNDGWFGSTPGPYQHLAQARLRAVEQRKPLIRAANTGISAYIDAYGRIIAKIPLNKMGYKDIEIPVQ